MLPQWLVHQALIYEAFSSPCAYALEAKFESAYQNSDATVKSGRVSEKEGVVGDETESEGPEQTGRPRGYYRTKLVGLSGDFMGVPVLL